MGFIKHNNTQYKDKTTVTVSAGDTAIFEIDRSNKVWEKLEDDATNGFKDTEVNLSDLINSAESWRQRASDLLVIGSKWIVGSSIWIVEKRVEHTSGEDRLHVHMKCVSIVGVPEIGIAGTRAVR